jgi:hypothetical protein
VKLLTLDTKIDDLTDESAKEYLPDHPSAHALFEVRRAQGDSVTEAMLGVLECYLGLNKARK